MGKKNNLVLDLDQTCISAEHTEDYNMKDKDKAEKAKKFQYHDMEGDYIVFERPRLQEFLDYVFENYTVSIWTAASKDYALFIMDNIILQKPERKLNYIFFSYHCKISENLKKKTKCLDVLWNIFKLPDFSKDNTMILDDYDEVHDTQPENCLIAPPFEVTKDASENDNFLPYLTTMLKESVNKPLKEAVPFINSKTKKKFSL